MNSHWELKLSLLTNFFNKFITNTKQHHNIIIIIFVTVILLQVVLCTFIPFLINKFL